MAFRIVKFSFLQKCSKTFVETQTLSQHFPSHTMAKTLGNKASGPGLRGANFVTQAMAAAKKGAARILSRKPQDTVAAEEHTNTCHASYEDDEETQQMVKDNDCPLAGAFSATQQGSCRDSEADTPPAQDKSVQSLSGVMKAGADGANNVGRLEFDRAKVTEYESKIEEL